MNTLKGIFPDSKPVGRKNYIQENVRNLRRMEQCFHSNKGMDELQKLQLNKNQKTPNKYQNIPAKVNSSFRDKRNNENNLEPIARQKLEEEQREPSRKASAPILIKQAPDKNVLNKLNRENGLFKQKRGDRKEQKLHGKVLSDPNFVHSPNKSIKFKNQGMQTVDTENLDDLYSEGMIRYPSKKCMKQRSVGNKNDTKQMGEKTPRDQINLLSDRGDSQVSENCDEKKDSKSPDILSSKDEIDFVKLNKERSSIASRMVAQLNNNVPPTNYRKGVVPKYIRDRKEAQEKEQKAKAEASDPDCPEGHVSLPDLERKETLRMLKKNYQDYVNELNLMPIKTDTLRAQRRKVEIEKQLNKLEEGIKVFSRPKVYVKVNA